jgi:hypothetical protein
MLLDRAVDRAARTVQKATRPPDPYAEERDAQRGDRLWRAGPG